VKTLRQIRLIGLIGLLSSCSNETFYIDDKFNGFFAETEWTYEFKKDGTFKFYTEGHYGNNEFKGRYVISDSTVFLNPDTDWQTFDGVIKPRLRIMNKECLRDYDNNYYCKNYEIIDNLNNKEFEFQEKAISIIDTLSIVKREKERLLTIEQDNHSVLDGEPEIRISYTGIIVIDRKEFHQFYVERLALLNTWRSLDLLVTKSPLTIYEPLDVRDSLRLIYREEE
jgi:hypothetical protein